MKRNLLASILILSVLGCAVLAAGATQAASGEPQTETAKKAVKKAVSVPGGKVNINTANAHDLDALPGVGPAIAQRIITYRQEHGRFQKPEDLMGVKGIGEKTFEKLKPYIATE